MKRKNTNFKTVWKNLSMIDFGLLCFRVLISLELIIVHGLKKVGVGGLTEVVPNPFNIPQSLNDTLAILANLFFPLLIIGGIFTRFATIPILCVTLTGYFIVHGGDSLLARDVPFLYSVAYGLIAISGPGKYSLDNYLSLRRKQENKYF